MTREELYEIWAPRGAVWTPWAKAVVFANFQWQEFSSTPDSPLHVPWLAHSDRLAIVVDLPGSFGVEMAIAMARRGYRPVPLYNAAPAVSDVPELVDVRSIRFAFSNFADNLKSLSLPFNAPPAFLLDANRRGVAGRTAWAIRQSFDLFPDRHPIGRVSRRAGNYNRAARVADRSQSTGRPFACPAPVAAMGHQNSLNRAE